MKERHHSSWKKASGENRLKFIRLGSRLKAVKGYLKSGSDYQIKRELLCSLNDLIRDLAKCSAKNLPRKEAFLLEHFYISNECHHGNEC